MNQLPHIPRERYLKIKAALAAYPHFSQPGTLREVREHSRPYGHGTPSKTFFRVIAAMGVYSRPRRVGGRVMRVVYYEPAKDKYAGGAFESVQKCAACGGTGAIVTDEKL